MNIVPKIRLDNATQTELAKLVAMDQAGLVTFSVKRTTGDPASGRAGQIVINTVDNTVKIYADAAWRTIASGW